MRRKPELLRGEKSVTVMNNKFDSTTPTELYQSFSVRTFQRELKFTR